MGNQNCFCHKNRSSDLSIFLDSTSDIPDRNQANITKSDDTFFTQYVQNNPQKPDGNEIQTVMDQRRIAFVTLPGFYTTWKNVPPVLLYSALCLLPLKRKWIMKPSKYTKQLQRSLINKVTQNADTTIQETLQFIKLLQWKDSQGLILWIFDYFDDVGNLIPNEKGRVTNPYVASFWYAFNDTLMSLYDPITKSNYKSIHLEEEWWANKDRYTSKYGVKAAVVLSELYFNTRSHSHNAVKEIIYQSNPQSLHPMTVYNNVSNNNKCLTTPVIVRAKDRLKAQSAMGIAISPLSPIKERINGVSVEVETNMNDHENKYDNVYVQCIQKDKSLDDTDDQKDEETNQI